MKRLNPKLRVDIPSDRVTTIGKPRVSRWLLRPHAEISKKRILFPGQGL